VAGPPLGGRAGAEAKLRRRNVVRPKKVTSNTFRPTGPVGVFAQPTVPTRRPFSTQQRQQSAKTKRAVGKVGKQPTPYIPVKRTYTKPERAAIVEIVNRNANRVASQIRDSGGNRNRDLGRQRAYAKEQALRAQLRGLPEPVRQAFGRHMSEVVTPALARKVAALLRSTGQKPVLGPPTPAQIRGDTRAQSIIRDRTYRAPAPGFDGGMPRWLAGFVSPQNNLAAAIGKGLAAEDSPYRRFADNLKDLAILPVTGSYALGKAALPLFTASPGERTKGLEQLAGGMAESFSQGAVGQLAQGDLSGALEAFARDPLFSMLDAGGVASLVGRSAGAAARGAGAYGQGRVRETLARVGSTTRPPLDIGTPEPHQREFSRDLIRKGAQVLVDRTTRKPARDMGGAPKTVAGPGGRRIPVLQSHGPEQTGGRVRHPVTGSEREQLQSRRATFVASRENAVERLVRDQAVKDVERIGKLPTRTRRALEEVLTSVVTGTVRSPKTAIEDLTKRRDYLADRVKRFDDGETSLFSHKAERDAAQKQLKAISKVLDSPKARKNIGRLVEAGYENARRLNALDERAVGLRLVDKRAATRTRMFHWAQEHMGARYFDEDAHRGLEKDLRGVERAQAEKVRQLSRELKVPKDKPLIHADEVADFTKKSAVKEPVFSVRSAGVARKAHSTGLDPGKTRKGVFGAGTYVAVGKADRSFGGESAVRAHLDVRKPFVIANDNASEAMKPYREAAQKNVGKMEGEEVAREITRLLEKDGYDSVRVKGAGPDGQDWVVAFHPEQIRVVAPEATVRTGDLSDDAVKSIADEAGVRVVSRETVDGGTTIELTGPRDATVLAAHRFAEESGGPARIFHELDNGKGVAYYADGKLVGTEPHLNPATADRLKARYGGSLSVRYGDVEDISRGASGPVRGALEEARGNGGARTSAAGTRAAPEATPEALAEARAALAAARDERIAKSGRDPVKVRAHEAASTTHARAGKAVKKAENDLRKAWNARARLVGAQSGRRGRRQMQAGETVFRGTREGGKRSDSGIPWWDKHLFVSPDEAVARNYGDKIEKITVRPDAKVLREGTPEFEKLYKGAGINNRTQYVDIAKAAKKAGYDIVHFKPDWVGSIVLNERALIRRGSTKAEKAKLAAADAKVKDAKQTLTAAKKARRDARAALDKAPMPKPRAALRKEDGTILTDKEILADIEAHRGPGGFDTLAYLPDRMDLRGAAAYHSQFRLARPNLNRETRTGAAYEKGINDVSIQSVADEFAHKSTQVAKAEQIDKALRENAVRHFAATKAKRGETLTAKEQKIVDRGGHFTAKEAERLREKLEADTGERYSLVRAFNQKSMSGETAAAMQNTQGMELLGSKLLNERLDVDMSSSARNVMLIPTKFVETLNRNLQPAGAIQRFLQYINKPFRFAVLAQPRWLTGNFVEPYLIRLPTIGSGPINLPGMMVDVRATNKLLRALRKSKKAEDRQLLQELQAHHLGGLFIGERGLSNRRVAEEIAGIGHYGGVIARLPVVSQLGWLVRHTLGAYFPINRGIESLAQKAALGNKLRREVQEFTGNYFAGLRMGEKAVDELKRGLVNTPTQQRFAKFQDDLLGQYTRFPAPVREIVQGPMPFLPWFMAAARFVYWTMPAKHPAKLAFLQHASTTVQEEWDKAHEPGKVPPGGLRLALPRKDGGLVDVARYTPYGFPGPVMSGDPSMLIDPVLPQIQGFVKALEGKDPFGRDLQVPKGEEPNRILIALYSALESMTPGVAQARRLREGGETAYSNSTLWNPKTKPGTSRGMSAFERTYSPLRPTYLRNRGPSGAAGPEAKALEAEARRILEGGGGVSQSEARALELEARRLLSAGR
jgi:hypothetical protein